MQATCKYCYGYGHNKMGCPKAKADANDKNHGDGTLSPLQQYDKWLKDNPDGKHRVSIYRLSRDFGWDYNIREAVSIQLEKRSRSRATKTCNFCGETGHNKRTCPALKEVKQKIVKATINYRREIYETIQGTGQGLGALISGNYEFYNRVSNQWEKGSGVALIQEHKWDRVTLHSVQCSDGEMRTNSVGDFFQIRWSAGHSELVGSTVSSELIPRDWRSRNEERMVVSPSATLSPPEGWLQCEDDKFQSLMKKTLKGRKAPSSDEFVDGYGFGSLFSKWAKKTEEKT